ncbi:MAG: hypothetical protein IT319_10985 [Anaerolineae bacterium]|nr:hypothetical protein [Anaerolineae bacterium]MCZ2095143.1 hypothetical protein [Anaerolineae bacterium]
MLIVERVTRVGRIAADTVRNILRGIADGSSQYAKKQTELYLMRYTDKGYVYELRRDVVDC